MIEFFEEAGSKYDSYKPEDSDSNINADTGMGRTMVGLLKDHLVEESTNGELLKLQGPILCLYAGLAGAEKELFSLLSVADQRMIAVDYNPNLKSADPRIKYLLGRVTDIIPTLAANSFGIITIYGADGSLRSSEWPLIWKNVDRLLRAGGYVLIFPELDMTSMLKNFRPIANTSSLLIAVKDKKSF